MKALLTILFFSTTVFVHAQKDSGVKSITINLGKEHKFSVEAEEEKTDYLKIFSTFFPVAVIVFSLMSVYYQIKARRKDDKLQIAERRKDERLKNQLDRLNKQISDFYGPLFTLYETGDQNYYIYLKHFGTKVDFRNQHFKNWSYAVFQPTNAAIEDIVVNKSDLILGNEVPPCLLQFCAWSATMTVYLQAQMQSNFDVNRWQHIIDETEHPQMEMQAYLWASFEVLKEEQSLLLQGGRDYVDENKLITKINERAKMYKDPGNKNSIDKKKIINDYIRKDIWAIADDIDNINKNDIDNSTAGKDYVTLPISLGRK